MKAIVLAGGEGTRLRPLPWTTPKPLLPIVNRPFLEHQLSWLAGHGVTEVVLSLGYRSDAFAGRSFSDLALQVAAEPEPLGTAGAIRFAADIGGGTPRFLVCPWGVPPAPLHSAPVLCPPGAGEGGPPHPPPWRVLDGGL